MKVLRRKILLDDLKRFDDGVAYDTITATSIYMKVEMTQTIDDLGMVTNLPFIPNGAECAQFDGSIIVTNVTCYDPNSPAPSSAYINVTVYGGQAPYTYNFSAGTNPIFNVTTNNTNYMLQNLAAGFYSVDVVDNLGCVVSLAGISENLSDVVTPTGYVILGAEYTSEAGTTFQPGTNIPFTDITTTISVCEGTPVTLGIDDPSNYTTILWSTGDDDIEIDILESGNYSVQASNGDCFGGTPEVSVVFIGQGPPVPPVISVTNLPAYATGLGTVNAPYVICNPFETTQGQLEFEVATPTAYDFFKWQAATVNGTPTASMNSEACVDSPCPQRVEVSSICDTWPNSGPNTGLLISNTIWILYDNNTNCIPLSEEGGD